MGRDFDGTNDQIAFGSDASIDDFVALGVAFTLKWDGGGIGDVIIGKASGISDGWRVATDSANHMGITRDFSIGPGVWSGGTAVNTSTHHYVLTHTGVVTDDPLIDVDGVAETVTEDIAPSGTLDADAANNLIAGESSTGTNDLDGALQNLVIHNAVLTAAEKNRCRWWGIPFGPSVVKVWLPMYTTDLVNKGTATVTGTPTGTTMLSLPVATVRPGTALMGMDVGW